MRSSGVVARFGGQASFSALGAIPKPRRRGYAWPGASICSVVGEGMPAHSGHGTRPPRNSLAQTIASIPRSNYCEHPGSTSASISLPPPDFAAERDIARKPAGLRRVWKYRRVVEACTDRVVVAGSPWSGTGGVCRSCAQFAAYRARK